MVPITQAKAGIATSTKSVSSQLRKKRVNSVTTMAMGFLMSISSELESEVSSPLTSLLIRDMMSPLRSSEKKLSGNPITLLYTCMRMSRTTPVRKGISVAAEPK